MRHSDTLDKIVGTYLPAVAHEPIEYKGKKYQPKPLVVSPNLIRGFTCPPLCGACCGSFSLDYLPDESPTSEAAPRVVQVNGNVYLVKSDRQADVGDRWCRNLDKTNGRCLVYDLRPMACDFELIRFLVYTDKVILTQKLYGRAWAMTRLNGSKGTCCEMLSPSGSAADEVLRKLSRLEEWADLFQIPTRISAIKLWIRNGDYQRPLVLSPNKV